MRAQQNPFGRVALAVFAALLLPLSAFIVARLLGSGSQSGTGAANAAAVLALVTAGAVAIERILETFWTTVGLTISTSWPFGPVAGRVNDLVADMNKALVPFHKQATEFVNKLNENNEQAKVQIDASKEQLRHINELSDRLRELGPDNVRAKALADAASRSVGYFEKLYPDLERASSATKGVINGAGDALASFTDNPARRLISLYAGAALGLLFAALFGLDTLVATLGSDPLQNAPLFLRNF